MKAGKLIPQETIDEILRRADMVSVVSRYTALKKRGNQFLGLCPFHGEKTPSFGVDPERGVYHCFGCGKGGGLIQFLREIENIPFVEAVTKLGDEVGVKVEQNDELDPAEIRRRRLLDIVERTASYYHEMLLRSPVAQEAQTYLQGRQLTQETIVRFRIGWAPSSGRALTQKLEKAGFSLEEATEMGVLRERNGQYSDTLRGRVVFPIFDAQDRVLAFGGRVIDDSMPKYLNTPESPIYSKRRQLYGLNLHRQTISKQEQAIVVEGYLDVVMLDQVGVKNAVASLGTALTSEQADLLRRYTRNVVLAYDADKAGQNATVKGIEVFEQSGLRVHVLPLKPGEDPDSLARKGGQAALASALEQAVGVVDYYIERCQAKYNLATPEGKEDFSREVLPLISKIRDDVRRNAYVVKIGNLLKVTESQVQWKLRGNQIQQRQHRKTSSQLTSSEAILFRVCMHYPECLQYTLENLKLDQISSPPLRTLFGACFAFCHSQIEQERGGFSENLSGQTGTLKVRLQDLLLHIEEPPAASAKENAVLELSEDDSVDHSASVELERSELEQLAVQLMMQEPPESSLEDAQKLVKSIQERSLGLQFEQLRREVVPGIEAGTIDPSDERFKLYMQLAKQLKGT